MKSKILLLLTLFIIIFLGSCKKEALIDPPEVIKPVKSKFIDQASTFLKTNYTAGSLNDLSVDSSILYKLDKGRFIIRVPLRTDGTKNFILISADSINGLKKGVLIHIDKTSNTSKGEQFNGTITVKELNGKIKEVRKIVNGYKINPTNRTSLEAPIVVLPEVVVISYVSSGTSIGWADWYNLLGILDGSGYGYNNWYGYDYGSGGSSGGGSSDYTPDPNAVEINFDEVATEPIDLLKYLNCFTQISDLGATYSIKICAQLPIDNDPSKILNDLATGHAFLTATKTNGSLSMTQNFGFYPESGIKSLNLSPVPSKIGDNDFTKYNASLTISATYDEFSTFMQTAINLSTRSYDLNNYNCTNYALDCFNSIRPSNNKLFVQDYIYNGINYKTTPNELYRTLDNKIKIGDPESSNVDMGVKHSSFSKGPCN